MKAKYLVILLSIILASNSNSQTLTFGLGLIENLQDADNQPKFAIYPEVQLSNDFYDRHDLTFGASVYWGYWDDGVNKLSSCSHCWTYSYSSHIVGARFEMKLKKFLIPLRLFFGISRHFIQANYFGGAGYAGGKGYDFAKRINAAEVGIRTRFLIKNRYSLTGNLQFYFPLDDRWYGRSRTYRVAFGLGLVYELLEIRHKFMILGQ